LESGEVYGALCCFSFSPLKIPDPIHLWRLVDAARLAADKVDQIRIAGNPNSRPMDFGFQPDDLRTTACELKIAKADESDFSVVGTQRQASLLKAGALHDAILNSVNFSSIATDAQGVIQIFNIGAERMLGYLAADVIDKLSPADISDPQELIARACALSLELGTVIKPGFEALAFKASHGIEDIYELTYIRKDGSRFPAVVSVTALRDPQDKVIGYLLIGTDNPARQREIFEKKKAQLEILRLNSELEERVRQRTRQLEIANEELGAFSYSISHDLRSPLATINGFSQLLLKSDGSQLSEKGHHYLDRIRSGAVNMGKLIDGLLSLVQTARATLSRDDVDLAAMANNLVQELRDSEPDRLVEVNIQAGLKINGDPAMVAVIMQNLIANSWKYSSKASNARIDIGSETTEGGVTCIFVRDNGAGFDMAQVGQLFETFHRLHQDTEFKGTGIGLANVRRMVERHGGRVRAEAAIGQGATFRFTLDAAQ
jgi:signal transduction histidine kinase